MGSPEGSQGYSEHRTALRTVRDRFSGPVLLGPRDEGGRQHGIPDTGSHADLHRSQRGMYTWGDSETRNRTPPNRGCAVTRSAGEPSEPRCTLTTPAALGGRLLPSTFVGRAAKAALTAIRRPSPRQSRGDEPPNQRTLTRPRGRVCSRGEQQRRPRPPAGASVDVGASTFART